MTLQVVTLLMLSCGRQEERPVRMAVASNLRYVMDSIEVKLEDELRLEIDMVYGPSTRLATQIVQGAPYDLIITADTNSIAELVKHKKTIGQPKRIAQSGLVLLSKKRLESPDELLTSDYKKIAMPNPDIAPYGVAGRQFLYDRGLESLTSKLVFGESVSQTNQFYLSGAADAAITSESVLTLAENDKKKLGFWIHLNDIDPLGQWLVIINHEEVGRQDIKEVANALASPDCQDIFRIFGYRNP